jgi:carbamate kinase
MRIVIALGGHSLPWRPAPMTAEVQRRNAAVVRSGPLPSKQYLSDRCPSN